MTICSVFLRLFVTNEPVTREMSDQLQQCCDLAVTQT